MEQVKKHIFWIILAVLLVVAVVASFFITGPVRSENETRIQSLEQRIVQLKKYAKDCKNQKWIDQAKEHQEMIQKEEKSIDKFLLEADFTRLFSEDRNDPNSKEQTDPSLWKDRYKEERNILQDSMKAAKVLLGPRCFHTRLEEWGERVPTRSEMEVANMEFWVLKDFTDMILALKDEQGRVRVYRLIQIGFPGLADFQEDEFDPDRGGAKLEEQPKRKTIRDTYLPIPVLVILDMDSKYVEKLLGAIVSSPWRYNIQTCDIIRVPQKTGTESSSDTMGPDGRPRDKTPELPKARKDLFENTTVRVRLYLEALDFSPLKKKKAEGEPAQ